MRDVNFRQRKLSRLEVRFDVFDEMQERFFGLGVFRVTGHGDVALGGFLVERGGEFAPRQQPAFEGGGGITLGRAGFKLVEQRRDLRPLAQINFLRHELTRLMRWQIVERQQIHRDKVNQTRRRQKGIFRARHGVRWQSGAATPLSDDVTRPPVRVPSPKRCQPRSPPATAVQDGFGKLVRQPVNLSSAANHLEFFRQRL